jgi:hypothetical protein
MKMLFKKRLGLEKLSLKERERVKRIKRKLV